MALVHNRVRAAAPGADPQPIALGFQLEQGGISPRAMVALCAGVLRSAPGSGWRPSAALLSLLTEYGAASGVGKGRNARAAKRSPAKETGAGDVLQ